MALIRSFMKNSQSLLNLSALHLITERNVISKGILSVALALVYIFSQASGAEEGSCEAL